MDYTYIHYRNEGGAEVSSNIQKNSVMCPHCKLSMIPQLIYGRKLNNSELNVFSQCTNPDCGKTFIANYVSTKGLYSFSKIQANARMNKKDFSKIIVEISPSFCEIYNQAYAAQQMELSQICGVGYRKALEFLIKDYIMSSIVDEKKESIKQKNLSKCISEDIASSNIKAVAARATWIGNDETHYVRKWEDKDIYDLIGLIDLTVRWIESEVETKRLLEEMPRQ